MKIEINNNISATDVMSLTSAITTRYKTHTQVRHHGAPLNEPSGIVFQTIFGMQACDRGRVGLGCCCSATHFVCHAYEDLFEHMVEALVRQEQLTHETNYYWINIFSAQLVRAPLPIRLWFA